MSDPICRCLRTEPVFYWLWGGLYGSGVVLGLATTITVPESGSGPPTIVLGFILALHMVLGGTTKLTLSRDTVSYRSFLRKVDIALSEVVGVEYATGFVPLSYKPYKRIIVTVRKTAGEKEVTLNAGLFAPREIKQWIKECKRTLSTRSVN